MSRSGYSDDCENLNLYRGTVERAAYGKRGQAFLRELVAALDAMPIKRLVASELETTDGEVCALGSLGRAKGIAVKELDTYDTHDLGRKFNIAHQLAAETMFQNDECGLDMWDGRKRVTETPEERWTRMRKWAVEQLRPTTEPDREAPRG